MKLQILALVAPLLIALTAVTFSAPVPKIKPDQVHTAGTRKSDFFIRDGLVIGGDRTINDVVVTDIRRGYKSGTGFERIVVDIENNVNGDPRALERPPYYHVAVSQDMNRYVVTIMGNPHLTFDADKVAKRFKNSPFVKKLQLLPLLEKDRWSFVLSLNQSRSVEVFELRIP